MSSAIAHKIGDYGTKRCRLLPVIRLGLFLTLLLLPVGCNRAPQPVSNREPDRLHSPVPRDRYPDDLARFLAGMPAQAGSALAGLHETEAWKKHSKQWDQSWTRFQTDGLPEMRVFQQNELSGKAFAGASLFYPFSGPDILMATVFFPKAPMYVMVGLEPAGTIPDARSLERKDLPDYLANIRSTLASELSRSFFVTHQMDKQFRGQITDGLLLPILQLLVRSGRTVLGFRLVRLDESGQLVLRVPGYKASGKNANNGVEIEFRTDRDQSVHKLFYFSVNLADSRLKENRGFVQFVSGLHQTAMYLKATSYMLHRREFSIIRELVLSRSAAVLQDDSGIPYQFYTAPQWRVQLYGDYVRPYGSFRWLEQPDLRKAYLNGERRPLMFAIGYGYRRAPSNLLLAVKENRTSKVSRN